MSHRIYISIAVVVSFTLSGCTSIGQEGLTNASTPTPSRERAETSRQSAELHKAERILAGALAELGRMFEYPLSPHVPLTSLAASEFEAQVGSPKLISALYQNGHILLLSRSERSAKQLRRTIRHEAVHAAFAQISGGNARTWIEEGFAQLFEGPPPESLSEALNDYLGRHEVPRLAALRYSFAHLETDRQAAAYGISRFAARTLVFRFGISALRRYLTLQKSIDLHEPHFKEAFGVSEEEFERSLQEALLRWQRSGRSLS